MSRLEYMKAYREANKEKAAAYAKSRYEENREAILKQKQEYYIATREERIRAVRAYQNANRGAVNAIHARREKRILLATPSWANHNTIREVYKISFELTETTGVQMHVDHIIPINGKNVCGLHTEENLQIIPATENWRKSNKHDPMA